MSTASFNNSVPSAIASVKAVPSTLAATVPAASAPNVAAVPRFAASSSKFPLSVFPSSEGIVDSRLSKLSFIAISSKLLSISATVSIVVVLSIS